MPAIRHNGNSYDAKALAEVIANRSAKCGGDVDKAIATWWPGLENNRALKKALREIK